jgi:hypothetical protein
MEKKLTETTRFILARLEESYNTNKIIFFLENPEKTELNFVESLIETHNSTKSDYERKSKLTDNEVFEEIKTGKRYLSFSRFIGKATNEEVKQFFDFNLKEYREKYKSPDIQVTSLRSKFYARKLKDLSITETTISSELLNTVDLSDSSAVKKIIYLNELGMIEFLQKQPCFYAVNNLATVLSAITGERVTTLQPILNPMLNTNSTAQKNNPYKTGSTVSKVKKQLTDLGFQSK